MLRECILTTVSISIIFSVFAQNPPTTFPMEFKVTTYAINDSVYTGIPELNDIVVSLYQDKSGTIHMLNEWRNVDTMSFGKISNLSERQYEQTAETYGATEYNFVWHYANDYNEHKGLADVQLTKIFKENNQVDFTANIYVRGRAYLISLAGYMEQ